MDNHYFERKCCVSCGLSKFGIISSIDKFPVSMACTNDKPENDLFAPLVIQKCLNCGTLQLKYLIDPKILYKYPHNPAIGKTWQRHNELFVDFIDRSKNLNDIDILDFGGGNSKIAKLILSQFSPKSYTIVDWNYSHYDLIKGVKYSENIPKDTKYDLVIASHTFEHFYEPRYDIEPIIKSIKVGGGLAFSIPNIESQLENNYLNALNFEHTYCPSPHWMPNNSYVDDNYIMHYYRQGNAKKDEEIPNNILVCAETPYIYLKDPVYIFGGHIFAQQIIARVSKGTRHQIMGILDNDPQKQGKRLYGTPYKVIAPEEADKKYPVIVNCAQYTNEISENLIQKGFTIEKISVDVLGPTSQCN